MELQLTDLIVYEKRVTSGKSILKKKKRCGLGKFWSGLGSEMSVVQELKGYFTGSNNNKNPY